MHRTGGDGFVYFVQATVGGVPGHVKIGHTQDLWRRFAALRADSPPEVELVPLGYVVESEHPERQLHDRFCGLRYLRDGGTTEWFRPGADLLAFIAAQAVSFPPRRQRQNACSYCGNPIPRPSQRRKYCGGRCGALAAAQSWKAQQAKRRERRRQWRAGELTEGERWGQDGFGALRLRLGTRSPE